MLSVTNEFAVLALLTGTERCHVIDDEKLLIYVAITTRGRRRIKKSYFIVLRSFEHHGIELKKGFNLCSLTSKEGQVR